MTDQPKNILNRNLDVLNRKVSYQENIWSPLSKEMTLGEALLEIQSDKYRQKICKLRSILRSGLRNEYSSHKRTLPAVTFCGTFQDERKKVKCNSYYFI